MNKPAQANRKRNALSTAVTAALGVSLPFMLLLCVCVGSVAIAPADVWAAALRRAGAAVQAAHGLLERVPATDAVRLADAVVLSVRLPRVLCALLTGAALSLCGAAMQGLLRNPLADGSTLGVTSGASLGAVLAIAFGLTLPGVPQGGTMLLAMLFAFLTLVLILGLAWRLDSSLSTNTIILVGVIFSMFASSLVSLVVTFAGERVRTILFWTMGSLVGRSYGDALLLLVMLLLCGGVLLGSAPELNAFAVGEENARHVGVNVRRMKLVVLITVSALTGVCVSIGGSIGFVGLAIPHIMRFCTGPNNRRLLPASALAGAVFLMLADLASRVVLDPLELPIGVVTSLIGSLVFLWVFFRTRKGR